MALVKLKNVWKRYKKWVLKDVNLSIDRGTVIGLVGPNGSGKSTLLNIIAGLVRPTRGEIIISEYKVPEDHEYKFHIGILLHNSVLYDELTVAENLIYYSKVYGLDNWRSLESVRELIEVFELKDYISVKVEALSHGWRKRVDIIRAFMHDPDIILLDEPFSGLDERAIRGFIDFLYRISEDKVIVFTAPNREALDSYLSGSNLDYDIATISEGRVKLGNR